jgi:hypothetical protein
MTGVPISIHDLRTVGTFLLLAPALVAACTLAVTCEWIYDACGDHNEQRAV